MKTKIMTKEQAEKAAMECAIEKINEGLVVWRTNNHNEIRIDFDTRHTSFPFIDLKPGDVCFIWDEDSKDTAISIFNKISPQGSLIFSSSINYIRSEKRGIRYQNYRPLGFNVLEIEKGWGDDNSI